jgi:hypothetical protein
MNSGEIDDTVAVAFEFVSIDCISDIAENQVCAIITMLFNISESDGIEAPALLQMLCY